MCSHIADELADIGLGVKGKVCTNFRKCNIAARGVDANLTSAPMRTRGATFARNAYAVKVIVDDPSFGDGPRGEIYAESAITKNFAVSSRIFSSSG
jgi:hypothetical protein